MSLGAIDYTFTPVGVLGAVDYSKLQNIARRTAPAIVWRDAQGNYNVVDAGAGPSPGALIVNQNIITSYGASLGAGTAGTQTQTAGIQEALNISRKVFLKAGTYIINQPIQLPLAAELEGENVGINYTTGTPLGTVIQPSSTFPANEYLIKYVCPANTFIRGGGVKKVLLYNPNFSTLNVQGLLIDGTASGATIGRFKIKRIISSYVDKTIDMEGGVTNAVMDDVDIFELQARTGTQGIIVGTGTSDGQFTNIRLRYQSGGSITNGMLINGINHRITNLIIAMGSFSEAPLKITNNNNMITNAHIFGTSVATAKGAIYLSDTSAYSNVIEASAVNLPKAVVIDNGAFRNRIRLSLNNSPSIDATGAGVDNIIEFNTGAAPSGAAFSLTHTGAAVIYRGYGINMFTKTITANYTATISDAVLLVDASGGARTITLPASQPHLAASGYRLRVVKIDSSANAVTVAASGTNTIEGAASKTLSSQNQKVDLITDGAGKWYDFGSGLV